MSSISIFAPNSINILAGINGLEVGQSIIIALLILLNDVLYLPPRLLLSLLTTSASSSTTSHPPTLTPAQSAHLSSIYLLLPFLGVSLALLKHNWFPARVFVGDTYCYFAGMVFAVVAIQGHFSKTLLLLLTPQVANFAYSVPQLFGLVPIPRHRLPHFEASSGKLEASWVDFGGTEEGKVNGKAQAGMAVGLPKYRPVKPPRKPKKVVQIVLKLLKKVRLLDVQVDEKTGEVVRCTNMTLINLWLVWFGPKREDRLCLELMALQTVLGLLGLWVRHRLALLVFTADNL